ncbi:MAG: phospholipase D-like domain-containing protein, partial [Clostridia bacterium]|nr:phospholipase D-like domain-containing protein [Clostridia bacterium]
HRKVLITEKKALITSANPHDASAYHSNIAFVVEGDILQDLLVSEKAVASLGVDEPRYEAIPVSAGDISVPKNMVPGTSNIDNMEICLLTEGKIKQHLLQEIKKTSKDDVIKIGMFYLSERDVIKELIKASGRGVEINLILDANKDAFGMEKNGIPNRPVAEELYKESGEKIKIKWYKTHGEQYHTKLILIRGREKSVVFGGSANLTRRNIGDYNLETDLKITANNSSKVIEDVEQYFRRVWNNTEGIYTVDFEEYREQSFWKRILYLFQEWSGLSTV